MWEWLSRLASPWGYVVVGAGAMLETSAFAGLAVPGETALIVGGFLAYRGDASLAAMMVVAFVGAVVGDHVGYWIGRAAGDRFKRTWAGRKVGEDRWARAESYLREKGGRAVFFGRFVGVLRALIPALAGANRMPYGRFAAVDLAGTLIWAPGLVLLGFLAGESYHLLEDWVGRVGLTLLGLVAVGVVWVVLRRRRRRRRAAPRPLPNMRAADRTSWRTK